MVSNKNAAIGGFRVMRVSTVVFYYTFKNHLIECKYLVIYLFFAKKDIKNQNHLCKCLVVII